MTTTTHFDSQQFEDWKHEAARELAADGELAKKATALLAEADRHGYLHQWSWLGLPMIQLPQDIVALQEIIWETRPEVIVETGVARGGSVIFSTSMLELLGRGKVIGIDLEIRAENRAAIESHPLARRVTLIEGSSTDTAVVEQVWREIGDSRGVMILLDSNHTHEHVRDELRLYSPMVGLGHYLVVSDTVVELIPPQSHRPRPWGPGNNPMTALREWLQTEPCFVQDPYMNAKLLWSSSPGGYLRRVKE